MPLLKELRNFSIESGAINISRLTALRKLTLAYL